MSAGALFFAGVFNVAELPFAEDVLDSTDVGYSVLATSFGLGFIAGSLSGSRGGSPKLLKARYQLGLALARAGRKSEGLALLTRLADPSSTAAALAEHDRAGIDRHDGTVPRLVVAGARPARRDRHVVLERHPQRQHVGDHARRAAHPAR